MSKGPIYNLAKSLAPNWAKRLYHRSRGARNRTKSTAEVFSSIYSSKQWGSAGTFNSGAGTLDRDIANPYIIAVSKALDERNIVHSRFVDLGCGDFRIGSQIAPLASSYMGGDVVPSLIEHLNKTYGNERTSFRCVDMILDELPEGDVCFIRQVLQHLSNDQIQRILPKLSRYNCVFITEHIPNRSKAYTPNIDKAQGPDIRLYWNSGVFLDHKPFSIPSNQLTEILSIKGSPVWADQDPGEIVTWVYVPSKNELPSP
jgi:hypothetical protein